MNKPLDVSYTPIVDYGMAWELQNHVSAIDQESVTRV